MLKSFGQNQVQNPINWLLMFSAPILYSDVIAFSAAQGIFWTLPTYFNYTQDYHNKKKSFVMIVISAF